MDKKYESAHDILYKLQDFETNIDDYSDNPEDDDYYKKHDDTPYRKIYKYIENLNKKDFTYMMIFEMAYRNKKVQEIIENLETIFIFFTERKHKYQKLDSKFNFDRISDIDRFSDIASDIFSCASSDIEYKQDLAENQKKFIELYFSEKDEKVLFKDELEILLNNQELTEDLEFQNICFIFELLSKKLKRDFFLYPDGYVSKAIIENLVVSREYIRLNTGLEYKTLEIDSVSEEFRKFKNTDMKSVADLFFIYDYHRYKLDESDKEYLIKNIKYALTKYHGIIQKGTSEIIPYKEFLENYNNEENNKENFFGYYITERSIRSKIAMMQKFIDECNYKYLFFN
ncbi:hypothetical protein CRU87_09235 [Aliarcobacter trophiarum LMG 25534]|uniref:Uncharacterized protein n=1 Tax=Aliarcobacter trophiarum LMG 25534 TaxID=1032241 RepID=A0AAD0VNE1_9BACT|nr:hypothetical protein [Aliarcobacter trophiarum]AXK49650.1 hypothetical protein ATR_1832 [Aliarcobacter trophiarum LMG 25534]RXJ89399.1 hypothetical protein CRU87_09235 [Aliarcobacter trophiarum LMG 25534]